MLVFWRIVQGAGGAALLSTAQATLRQIFPREQQGMVQAVFLRFGLGFLFTPINNAAYGNIDPRIAQQAAGLINLSRQIGGSFGIAILGTYLNSHIQMHRVELSRTCTPAIRCYRRDYKCSARIFRRTACRQTQHSGRRSQ
jgi:MFS family permease